MQFRQPIVAYIRIPGLIFSEIRILYPCHWDSVIHPQMNDVLVLKLESNLFLLFIVFTPIKVFSAAGIVKSATAGMKFSIKLTGKWKRGVGVEKLLFYPMGKSERGVEEKNWLLRPGSIKIQNGGGALENKNCYYAPKVQTHHASCCARRQISAAAFGFTTFFWHAFICATIS